MHRRTNPVKAFILVLLMTTLGFGLVAGGLSLHQQSTRTSIAQISRPIAQPSPQIAHALYTEHGIHGAHLQSELMPAPIYTNFTPPTDALTELLQRHGYGLSVYFQNLETGFVFAYNADHIHFSASLPKAVYAFYLFHLAEQGLLDLDSRQTYTWADFSDNSGIIHQRYPVGTSFSTRELIRLNVSESDDVATLILRRVHGLDGYRAFISDIGGNPAHVGAAGSPWIGTEIMNSHISANEAGLFMQRIFEYLESGGAYSAEFQAALLDNQFPFIVSDYPVASKSGWTAPFAWHDMAIVYAPSPFILVILSQRTGWTEADYRDFAEISMAFQAFNDTWFVNP
ncbi:MAG: class A beta-lactamase-related serine hydrolase [Oscillospiraceae bacterium]|nr:class A beta-lactamase-related serine hydrolase [Oscillospiraceae bacterium]